MEKQLSGTDAQLFQRNITDGREAVSGVLSSSLSEGSSPDGAQTAAQRHTVRIAIRRNGLSH
ncbi:MAG: hypothetical protein MJ102_05595 [Clostridia bacterium]|nr:hypothetical protein [Clostridia bacterium]